MIGRRDFITLLGGAAAWPLVAGARRAGKTYRVGFLTAGAGPSSLELQFVSALAALGYQEGSNLVIERLLEIGTRVR
jgi:putative ABC transport system substrate-binding protein